MTKRFSSWFAVLLCLCSALWFQTGCSEAANSGATISIPHVTINCQTANCRTNSSPVIAISITSGPCTAGRAFGEVVAKTTRSINCNGTSGCFGEPPDAWYSRATSAPTTTMPSGTYTVCACINYNSSAIPWASCDTTGEKDNVYIDSTTGPVIITGWVN